MKRKGYQISIALAAALFMTGVPVWAELTDGSTEQETLCESCQNPMPDGFCSNTAAHAEGVGIVLEAADLSTDSDSMASAYEIENAGQLAWFVRELGAGTLTTANAFLTEDIDWSVISTAGVNWTPIGSYVEAVEDVPYTGVFNGNGYVLSGLTFSDMENGVPMTVFGNIGSGAVVKELGLEDIWVTSDAAAVSVLAWKNQGKIEGCYVNDTFITANMEGAVVSDIAAMNSETGTIKNTYSAVTVTPGMKADQSGTVTLLIDPICGENLNLTDSEAIDNNYYLQTEDPLLSPMMVIQEEGSGIKGETAAVFASGSVAWKLNDGRDEAIFGQTLAEYAALPEFIRDESHTDSTTGAWVEEIYNKPIHLVTLDFTDEAAEDLYYFVNDRFLVTSLPAETQWQMMQPDGSMLDVTADLEVTSDLVLTQVIVPSHSFTNYISNGDATCIADGTKTALCDCGCGLTDTQPDVGSSANISHQFTNYIPDGNATCAADGTKTAYCDHGCGATDTQPDVGSSANISHQFTNYVPDGNATCVADGTKTAYCDHGCGAMDNQPDVGSSALAAHIYTNYVSNEDATCIADGTKTAVCDLGCGTVDTQPDVGSSAAIPHRFTNYVSNNDATCIADGTKTANCDQEGCTATDVQTDEGSSAGIAHQYGEYVSDGNATCIADGTKTATCIVEGCGATHSEPDVGSSALAAHTFTNYVSDGNATCVADGTKTAVCDLGCGTVDTQPDVGSSAAISHRFINYTSDNNATCAADGTKTAVCEQEGCTATDVQTDEGSSAGIAHHYGEYVSDGNATCIEDGTKTATCIVEGCGKTDTQIDEGSSASISHQFSNYLSNNNATCIADGTKTAICDVVGCDASDTQQDVGSSALVAHTFTNYVSDGNATCAADGTKTANCEQEGCTATDVQTDEGSSAEIAHQFTNYVSDENATCQKNATETAVCNQEGCGETDTREKEGTKVEHSYGEYHYDSNAGCLKNGTETAYCIYECGEKTTREAEGTIIPHKFELYVHNDDATCQVSGTETAICAYGCNTADTRTITDTSKVVPHNFEKYTYNNDATCQKNGTETAYCTFECGQTDTREVEGTQKEHTFEKGICTVCKMADVTWIADEEEAIVEEAPTADGWHGSSVTLKAPEGCFINTKNTEDFGTATTITVELKNGANTIVYYLRRGNGKIVERKIQLNADQTVPSGSVSVGSVISSQAVTNVTFDLYFGTTQIIRIQAQDGQSGMKSIEYLVATQAMTEEALKSAVWTAWDTSTPVSMENDGSYIVYAKLTDNAGNTSIINTNGFVIDKTAPKIDGAVNGGSVCPETALTITDVNPMTITLNNRVVELEEGKLSLTETGKQTLRVVDRAGNQIAITFTVNEDHAWDAGVIQEEETCTRVGFMLHTCTLCQASKTAEIPMVDHIFSHYQYNNDATCQQDGTQTALCDFGCNTTNTITAEGTKTDHKFTTYVYNNDATCQLDGTKTASCDFKCNTTHTITAEGTKAPHKFSNYVYNQDGTCLANGTKTAICDYGCNTIDTVVAEGSMTGHKFSNYVYNNDATCKGDGTKTASCDYGCETKDTITAENTRLAHTYGTDHICVICKEVDPATLPTTAPSNPNVPILGIEDFGGIWGIALISIGAIILVIVGVIFAVSRKRR